MLKWKPIHWCSKVFDWLRPHALQKLHITSTVTTCSIWMDRLHFIQYFHFGPPRVQQLPMLILPPPPHLVLMSRRNAAMTRLQRIPVNKLNTQSRCLGVNTLQNPGIFYCIKSLRLDSCWYCSSPHQQCHYRCLVPQLICQCEAW